MNAKEIANEGIVTQLAVVHTMLPKVKELIDQQADYIKHLEQGLESSITLNKAQLERLAELERKHKEEFDYAEKLLKEQAK